MLNITNVEIDINTEKESNLWRNFLPIWDLDVSMIWLKSRIHPYSNTAPWTKIIQPKTHVAIDVNESVSGELAVMLMNKFTKTKSRVISKPILPGTHSWGIKKLI